MAAKMSSSRALVAAPVKTARIGHTSARPIRATRVMAVAERDSAPLQTFKLAMAGVAAGLLMHTGAAEAGVQMVQPEVKKVFQSDGSATKAVKKAAAPVVKSAPAPGPSFAGAPSIPLLAVSGSVVGLGAFGAVFSKMDGGAFMSEGLLKDSTGYAGYETVLKSEAGPAKTRGKKSAPKKKGFF